MLNWIMAAYNHRGSDTYLLSRHKGKPDICAKHTQVCCFYAFFSCWVLFSANYGIYADECVHLHHPDCMMVKELVPDALKGVSGYVNYKMYNTNAQLLPSVVRCINECVITQKDKDSIAESLSFCHRGRFSNTAHLCAEGSHLSRRARRARS